MTNLCFTLSLACAVGLAGACGDSSSRDPYSTLPEPGVRREVFLVPGVHPEDHPEGIATPSSLDFTQVVRYREDAPQPLPTAAIVVAMPGWLGGAGAFDGLARSLVLRGTASGRRVEVWAIDRRSNLLEDTFGLDIAEERRDPELAVRYYQLGEEVDGHRFGGFTSASDLRFMSEWGLRTHVEDVHRVIALVPEALRKGHVFLMGHSLGGAFTEAYAGWVFESDGRRGAEELAGIALIDGSLGGTSSTETQYTSGSGGLGQIRASSPFYVLPALEQSALVNLEIVALQAHYAPELVTPNVTRDEQTAALFGYSSLAAIPPMTNRAQLGLIYDSASQPIGSFRATCGSFTGPTESFASFLGAGPLQRPSDSSLIYDWIDGPSDPDEYVSVLELAESMVHGESNFEEWYFPNRISLDLGAVSTGTTPTTGFPSTYGLRVFAGSQNDAPVLCIVASNASNCDGIRTRIAPAIGPGRPLSGATRGTAGQDVDGFRVLGVPSMAHVDPVVGRNHPQNPVPAKVEAFIAANTESGTVLIPLQPR